MALTDDLVVHMNFADDLASNAVLAQVGSNGSVNGGVNTNAIHTTGPNAAIPSAFELNGTDQSVTFTGFSRATTEPYTIAVWARPDNVTGKPLFGITGAATSAALIASATAISLRNGGGTTFNFTVPSMSIGSFYFLCYTKDASNNIRGYQNGVESSTGAQAGGTGTFAPTRVGQSNTTFFDGRVAAFSAWNRALSGAEIAQLYSRAYPWGFNAALARGSNVIMGLN